MAGVVGFEPTHHGIRIHCLTTWLYPYVYNIKFSESEQRIFIVLWGGWWDSNPRIQEPQPWVLTT